MHFQPDPTLNVIRGLTPILISRVADRLPLQGSNHIFGRHLVAEQGHVAEVLQIHILRTRPGNADFLVIVTHNSRVTTRTGTGITNHDDLFTGNRVIERLKPHLNLGSMRRTRKQYVIFTRGVRPLGHAKCISAVGSVTVFVVGGGVVNG